MLVFFIFYVFFCFSTFLLCLLKSLFKSVRISNEIRLDALQVRQISFQKSKKQTHTHFFCTTEAQCNPIRFTTLKKRIKYTNVKPQKSIMAIKKAKTMVITCEIFQRHKISAYCSCCFCYYYLLQFLVFMGYVKPL